MDVTIHLTGQSPLLVSNPQMVDPDFEINVLLKQLTSKRNKTEDDRREIERLEWYGRLYVENGIVVEPTSKPRKATIEAAKIYKLGKTAERALLFGDVYAPLVYDGPKDIDKMFASGNFANKSSVVVNRNRVMRTRPMFFPWALSVSGLLLTEVMNKDDFVRCVNIAGRAIGIGDNRINGYGRFSVEVEFD